jgi:hypothetical protein
MLQKSYDLISSKVLRGRLSVLLVLITLVLFVIIFLGIVATSPQTNLEIVSLTNQTYSGVEYSLFYPSQGSNFPLIIFLSGIGGMDTTNTHTFARMSYACLVLAATPTNLSNAKNYIMNEKNNLEAILPFIFNSQTFPITINQSKVGIFGVSGGGNCALLFNDTRIKATVAYQPYYAIPPVLNRAPVFIITTSDDSVAPYYTNGLRFYNNISSPKIIADIVGYNHYQFPQTLYRYVKDWFNYYLDGNTTGLSDLANISSDSSIDKQSSEKVLSSENPKSPIILLFIVLALLVIFLFAANLIARKHRATKILALRVAYATLSVNQMIKAALISILLVNAWVVQI